MGRRTEVVVHLDRGASPIEGEVRAAGLHRRFHGWLELMDALASLPEAGGERAPGVRTPARHEGIRPKEQT